MDAKDDLRSLFFCVLQNSQFHYIVFRYFTEAHTEEIELYAYIRRRSCRFQEGISFGGISRLLVYRISGRSFQETF